MNDPWLSVIIPVRNEGARIGTTLAPLQPWRPRGVEVLVVDGDSSDHSALLARELADRVLASPPGRARQMNLGAGVARGGLLWFLHADTLCSDDHLQALQRWSGQPVWGRFDVRLSGPGPLLKLVAAGMNLRSRCSGIATGDQGIFVEPDLFRHVGGFPDQPLMEDVELSARLRREAAPACERPPLRVDSRRWESRGRWRTIILMWQLRWAYWRGVDPESLHRRYYGESG